MKWQTPAIYPKSLFLTFFCFAQISLILPLGHVVSSLCVFVPLCLCVFAFLGFNEKCERDKGVMPAVAAT